MNKDRIDQSKNDAKKKKTKCEGSRIGGGGQRTNTNQHDFVFTRNVSVVQKAGWLGTTIFFCVTVLLLQACTRITLRTKNTARRFKKIMIKVWS